MSHSAHAAPRMRMVLGIAATILLAVSAVLAAPQSGNAAPNPNIVITESDGSTNIHPDGPTTDSYTIQLATPAIGRTWFTIIPTAPSPFAEISIDGGVSWGLGKMVLNIPAGDTSAHAVMVRWAYPELTPDDFPPDSRVMTILHPADSLDPDYDASEGVNVYVGMEPAPVVPPAPEPVPAPSAPTLPQRVETAA